MSDHSMHVDIDDTDQRQGVSRAGHDVLDCLEELAEGPFSRGPVDDILSHVNLLGDTVFGIALAGPRAAADPDQAGRDARLERQAIAALLRPEAVRMAALLLLGIERARANKDAGEVAG